ncbi:hypothetical protein [Nitratifractor salsuginis]|uniref:Uncharacterized protein n=1 Tax=Nitratifractor salsuginis (strain DSM 16511 / JCM 12458 / E9I37-1) TaxID=749222 RepID=E6WYZ6_NITSE|nr:hypothetical protein [Nitratifractor salsuginis]ADV45446.1 hypothetical protein Nitsa_0173 [Nitratifractor salsuginis DSM 16511]
MPRKYDNTQVRLYDEEILKLGISLYEKGKTPLELFYYLLSARRLNSFSIIVLEAEMENLGQFLKKHKRKTDLLYELDDRREICVLFCQETQVDGGIYFLKRLAKAMHSETPTIDIRSCVLGVEGTNYPVRNLLFIVLDCFVKVHSAENEEDKILWKTVK